MIYRWDDLVESTDFEHDQKFVKAENWKEACDEADENRKSVIFLQEEIQKLQEQNKKLRECVEFYANFMNYSNLTEYGVIYRTAVFSDMEEINEFTKHGGKRARQVLKEIEK